MAATSTNPTASARWLFSPWVELALGCGGLYLVAFAVLSVVGSEFRAVRPSYLFSLLILLFLAPHYGATLLRVYEHAKDRRTYRLFAVHATLLVVAAFGIGLTSVAFASWMITLYLTWSPWHYTGQNYGIGLMFLGRSGVKIDPPLKRVIYTGFILSYAMVFLVMHGPLASDGQVGGYEVVRFMDLGLPIGFINVAFPVLLAGQAACVVASVGMLLRRATLARIVPFLGIVTLQLLWFTAPVIVGHWGLKTSVEPIAWDLRLEYFTWIAVGHALQYLWVTTYYARAAEGWSGFVPYWGKALLAGESIAILPVILFGPDALGSMSFPGGLFLLVAAAVNLHHFILDGAIWKLRSGPVARVLLQNRHEDESATDATGEGAPWGRRALWAVAAIGTVIGVANLTNRYVLYEYGIAGGNLAQAEASLDRLRWFGADDEKARFALGRRARAAGDQDRALRSFTRSAELRPSVPAYLNEAVLHQKRGENVQAREAFEKAVALAPDDPQATLGAGVTNLVTGRTRRARALLERAVAANPENAEAREALAAAEARSAQTISSPGSAGD